MALIHADVVLTGTALTPGRRQGEIKAEVKKALLAGGLFLEGELVRATPFGVSGKLRRGWETSYDDSKGEATVGNVTEYVLPVELGRKPAPVPIDPLTLWVRRKLQVQDEKKARGIAFAISRKKRRKRTPGQGFADKTFDENVQTLNTKFLFPIGVKLVKRLGGR